MRKKPIKHDTAKSAPSIQRFTRVRRSLLALFEKTAHPLSVPELLEQLKKDGVSANKTTIYRQLDSLREKGIIKEIPIAGHALHYELATQKNHHHHLICVTCHRKQDISVTEDFKRHERSIKKKQQFDITHHSLEFYGYCKHCR